ncbi:hypothetical protein N836_16550 [Leptolyngbya sp. Heron Island J]|uniref:hypothetical protein n=1 Tax=Leptolyngbya sp. Heron Island J TaxID=1385935 RepID=UPI0003B97A93|nr:hypothetical protein [Leptolyngbya sp. Heron Island J]ESA34505.1 hypothetical protein N836_16550 [Leptolyngbya sp. Heron Island J]
MSSTAQSLDRFRISPLIKVTLLSFYVALLLPLPFLAQATDAPVGPGALVVLAVLGAVFLGAGLSEQVQTSDEGIAMISPLPWRGWFLKWSAIKALKPRSTGQNGTVYYFITEAADRAYLLPMRVVGFARLVGTVEAKTGIDTQDVKPLAQPWMYLFLLVLTALLLLMDAWTVWTATHGGVG